MTCRRPPPQKRGPTVWVAKETVIGIMLPLVVAVSVTLSPGQIVQVGPTDPNYCYKIETIHPNLELHKSLRVIGTVSDQLGAPLKNSPVELRKYISQRKQVNVKMTKTDADGRFDLGTIELGRYRLLPSPSRVFKQPSKVQCENGSTCDLKITLMVNATDQPDSICPIR
jgi:5-hydroxyisourate hydrolase-like protein (transthyretin family)